MKITNNTHYETRHLRAFVTRIAKKELAEVDPARRKAITIEFVHTRTSQSTSGYAYCNGYYTRIRLPKNLKVGDHWMVAKILAHEFHHLAGRKGGRENEYAMRRSIPYGWHEKTPAHYSWAEDLPLEVKVAKIKPTPTPGEKAEANIARIEKLIANWETKAKRAKNALAKYRRQLKYHQGRVIALSESSDSE